MRKFIAVLTMLMVVLALTVVPVFAITGNYVKDFDHPFVGLAVFYDESDEFVHRCSGSLLSPTVFLTAGHCTDSTMGATNARIYFQQDAGAHFDPVTGTPDPFTGYPDTCAAGTLGVYCATSHALYNYGFADFAGFPNNRDVGLVILDQPISLSEYGQVAAAGTLDPLDTKRGRQDLVFKVSGYGLTYSSPVTFVSFRERLMADSKLVNLNSALTDGFNLQTNGNGKGKGGTCSGDSGGPVFYPADSNTIVAVTSFGLNEWCRGVDFAYWTDRQDVIDWILHPVP